MYIRPITATYRKAENYYEKAKTIFPSAYRCISDLLSGARNLVRIYHEDPDGFYNIPIVVAFMLAILTACFQNRSLSFDRKLELMGQGIGDKNIITMLLIFLTAGTFVGVVGRSSAEALLI